MNRGEINCENQAEMLLLLVVRALVRIRVSHGPLIALGTVPGVEQPHLRANIGF